MLAYPSENFLDKPGVLFGTFGHVVSVSIHQAAFPNVLLSCVQRRQADVTVGINSLCPDS